MEKEKFAEGKAVEKEKFAEGKAGKVKRKNSCGWQGFANPSGKRKE